MLIMIKPRQGETIRVIRSAHAESDLSDRWVVLEVEKIYLKKGTRKNAEMDCEVQDSLVARTAAEPWDD